MSKPSRWLHATTESTDEERALLRLGLDVGPPPGAEDRTWQAILTQLGPPPGPGSPPSTPSPAPASPPPTAAATGAGAAKVGAAKVGALGLGGVLKTGLAAVVSGTLLVGGGHALLRSPPAAMPATMTSATAVNSMTTATAATSAVAAIGTPDSTAVVALAPRHMEEPDLTASAPSLPAPAAPPTESPPVASDGSLRAAAGGAGETTGPRHAAAALAASEARVARGSGEAPAEHAPGGVPGASGTAAVASAAGAPAGTPAPSPQAERASRLREESALVGQANAALRGGNAGEALRLLAGANARFADGVLGQERELLTIEALAQSGQRAAASERAGRFLQAHPQSPYAARLKPYLL